MKYLNRIAFAIFFLAASPLILLMMLLDRKFRAQMIYIGSSGKR